MKIDEKKIDALIETYDKRAQAAYDNYQDSGADTYYRTFQKNEAMRDLLIDAKNAQIHIERSKSFSYHLRMWAAEIEAAKSKDMQAMAAVMDSIRAQIILLEKML
jgi:hypothetical protein